MKKLLTTKNLVAILLILVMAIAFVGCDLWNKTPEESTGTTTNIQNPDPETDKTALNAELALEVSEQGDYTAESYNKYAEKLTAAKAVAADAEATQEAVDAAAESLKTARLALVLRSVEVVEGTNREFTLISGDAQEIALADYVNVNGLSKITYEVKVSNAVLEKTDVVDGKFTVTAGEVREDTTVTVSVAVKYDGINKVEFELSFKITNDVAPALKNEAVLNEVDIFDLADKEGLVIDFADNVNNAGNLSLSYSVKCGEESLTLDGTRYTVALNGYGDTFTYTEYTVTVTYTANGTEGTLTYTYKLGIKDTSAYGVENGNFENGLEGWELNVTQGKKPFGGVHNAATFWGEGYPMFNVGNYFSAYADGAEEASQGTLTSSYFVARGKYATYMLGGAGNHNVYITIEDKEGNVLGLYRNTQFRDHTEEEQKLSVEEKRAMIGNTVFLANFVTYKVDIEAFAGQELRFVVHDYASSNWGVVFFDELITYYTDEALVPQNAVLAENLLANKNALNAEIALKVTAQGDYTAESYAEYVEKFNAAKTFVDDIAATQAMVDAATAALTEARLALTARPVEEVAGAIKSFGLTSGNGKEISLADYINTNGLSKITYGVETSSELVALSSVENGKFTITAGEVSEATDVTVSIVVYYDGVEKLRVDLVVGITNDVAPTLFADEISKEFDIFNLTNKTDVTFNLAENVDNKGNLALTYSVNGVSVDGDTYTFTFGQYTDDFKDEALNVTVSYEANGEAGALEYTIKMAIKDTTAYRLSNGGFENGLEGWTVVGNIGGISSDRTYWAEAIEFGMDGEKMFSAYAPGALESAVGTLTSSTFVVGGSNFVTFKIGAMKDANYVYVDLVDAETKQILARYSNGLFVEDECNGCKLVAYKANLAEFEGREVFFRISDNADSGYGLFFADSFVTYYENEPEGFNDATPVSYTVSGTIYDVFNGGFEMGDVQGWWNDGVIGVVTNANAWDSDGTYYGKVGEYLFTGTGSKDADTFREGNRGSLTSSVFEIGGTGWISFKLGGGGNALCYVQIIDAVTGEVLARYRQQAQNNATLIQYVADLSAYVGRTVRIQVVDQADREWGCVSFDNVITYYPVGAVLPEGHTANDIKGNLKYTIDNGSFENGLEGWVIEGEVGVVTNEENDEWWYTKNDATTKDGAYLFTFAPKGANYEGGQGTLTSSTFSLKQGAYVSFRFGGAGENVEKKNHDVYIELCREDGSVIAKFFNDAEGKVNTKMNAYYYQYEGAEVNCFFRVVDRSGGNYGCFVVDDFRVNLESAPEGFIAAIQ